MPNRERVRGVGGISMTAASAIGHKERTIQALAPEAGGPRGAGSNGASLLQEHGGRDSSGELTVGYRRHTTGAHEAVNANTGVGKGPEATSSGAEGLEAGIQRANVPPGPTAEGVPRDFTLG